MQNNDLTQAIRRLEQETQKEIHELQLKEEELRKREAEVTDIKNKLHEHERAIPHLKQEIMTIKREQVQKHDELTRVQKNYQEDLRKSSIKLR